MTIACNLVFDHRDLRIINTSVSSFRSARLYQSRWPTNVVWLLTVEWSLQRDRGTIREITNMMSSSSPGQSVCILVNEPEEIAIASEMPGVEVEYVNHNALISPRVFSINGAGKIYDAVVNASALPLKRTHLCARIENLCCIRRLPAPEASNLFDAATLQPRFVNHETLSKRKVAELLNQSYCGVILSECEGACFASTEYLLCGLPVVSTPSIGGRHVWYDESTSIIVEPDEDAVRDAVATLKRRCIEGAITPGMIRENALQTRDRFIRTAEAMIARYLERFGIDSVSAHDVMRSWLAEMDIASRQFKYLPSEDAARQNAMLPASK